MRHAAIATLGLGLGLVLSACGDGGDGAGGQPTVTKPGGAIELTVVYDDGAGKKTTGALTCRDGDQRAEGALKGRAPAAELCSQARGLAELLTTQPEQGRACTEIYGGPETAHVTGTIDGRKVDRRFARTNGCEMADFTRAAGLLSP